MLAQEAFAKLDEISKYTLYCDSQNLVEFLKEKLHDALAIDQFLKDYVKGISGQPLPDIPTGYYRGTTDETVTSTMPNGPVTRGRLTSQATHHTGLNSTGGEPYRQGNMHLFLPREAEIKGLIIGDSITKRIEAKQVGESVAVRGYGGATSKDILNRVANSRVKQIDGVTVCIGTNDCLQSSCKISDICTNIEKLIYTINHKFQPKRISIATVTPLLYHKREFNANVVKLNKQIAQLPAKVNDIDVEIVVLDVNKVFCETESCVSSDGIHPSLEGLKQLVVIHRETFSKLDIPASTDEVTFREYIQRKPMISANNVNGDIIGFYNNMKQFFKQ